MDYGLLCNGRIREGFDEVAVVLELQKLTKRSPAHIRMHLLSGKPVKLKSGTNLDALQALHDRFYRLGLDVTLEPLPKPAISTTSTEASIQGSLTRKHFLGATVLALVIALGVSLWSWFEGDLPETALRAEVALADGQLLAVAHIDVDKWFDLDRLMLGVVDPEFIDLASTEQTVLKELLQGPAAWRESLQQAFFSLHAGAHKTGQPLGSVRSLFLTGEFDKQIILETLRKGYQVKAAGSAEWYVISQRPTTDPMACPSVLPNDGKASLIYLHVSPAWLLMTDNLWQGERLLSRIASSTPAEQSIQKWQDYRQGKLASFMVLAPQQIASASRGMIGAIAGQATEKAPSISAFAASLDVDLLQWGMHGNLRLESDDAPWRRSTVESLRETIRALGQDGRKVSPLLGQLLAGVTVSEETGVLAVDVNVDQEMGEKIGQLAREALAQVLNFNLSKPESDGLQQDQIERNPTDYAANRSLQTLPALTFQSHETKPLFVRGSHGADLVSARMTDDGVLELRLKGVVAVPASVEKDREGLSGQLAFQVTDVLDAAGKSLMRDERCLSADEVVNRNLNHEPMHADRISPFLGKLSIEKHVRLRHGVPLEAVAQLTGKLMLSAPIVVRTFTPELQVGNVVELGGMRWYLSGLGDDSVSYQLSGNSQRLLEVRALNKKGDVLQKSWRMSDDVNRITQHFEGRFETLQVFVAERVARHEVAFTLNKLFKPSANTKAGSPTPHAPQELDGLTWQDFAALDVGSLSFKGKDWYVSGKNKLPVANTSWPGVRLFITHTPAEWDNAPQAHLFFPMLGDLPNVLSSLSYRIDDPAPKAGGKDHFIPVSYPYASRTGTWVIKHRVKGMPLASRSIALETGLAKNEKLDWIKGKLIYRQPLELESKKLDLRALWHGKREGAISIKLTEAGRGMFPGYRLRLTGDLSKLVQVYGLSESGQRVSPDPVNFQQDGALTMTLPFGQRISHIELVTARRQKLFEYPFDLKAIYP